MKKNFRQEYINITPVVGFDYNTAKGMGML